MALFKSSLIFMCATQYLNAPYKWAANGPFEFDCSGLVLAAWKDHDRLTHSKVFRKDMTSQGIYDELLDKGYQCTTPTDGCILFYGESTNQITHIAIHGPKNILIEAGGAGQATKKLKGKDLLNYCTKKDARVRYRNFGHRNDLVASIQFEK